MNVNRHPKRLREWRERLRLSQVELAKFMDVAPPVVSRWENDGPGGRGLTADQARRLAGLFKIPTYALYFKPIPIRLLEWHDGEYAAPNRIKELREGMRLVVSEVSSLTAISTSTLDDIESGKTGMHHHEIMVLARLFKVPSYQLFVPPLNGLDAESFEEEDTEPVETERVQGDPDTPYHEYDPRKWAASGIRQ